LRIKSWLKGSLDPCFNHSMPRIFFDHLDDTEFEEFAFKLLLKMGFVNVDWRKGTPKSTSPADGGRDIVCFQPRVEIDRSLHVEKWFVDCKHYEKGVPPKELDNLLTWSQAERPDTALFIVSGFLSNPAKDYLERYRENNRPPFKIKYWEQPQLEQLTVGMRKLLYEYNLMPESMRSVKEIIRAEEEFFDKIWYDRSLLHELNDKERKLTIDPDLAKTVLAARARVEKKWGKKALRNSYHNDFEWGMLNGKLSALRWVLGSEWDFLDT
jgi:hypothetical protein